LAVIDRTADRLVVWHVNTGPDPRLSRLTGCWVVDIDDVDTLRNLVHDYPAAHVSTDVILPQGITSTLLVDVDSAVRMVTADVAAADLRFTEHAATVKHDLVRPDWPAVEHPAARPTVATPEPLVAQALTLAIGLADLADAWAEFEALRLARDYLIPLGGPTARPLPLEKIR
jgi:hypothetical protein